jgi:choline dehydrogenase
MAEYDYVIVGAGAAGCVLANRLSANPAVSVCLVEAGGNDRHPFVHMPRGCAKLVRMPSHMYFYMTQPEEHNGMRGDVWLRGKVLGGSTSVNGMVWVRGQPGDYATLAAETSEDWNWDQFARAWEAIEGHELGAAPGRGGTGPLRVSIPPERSALTEAILAAGAKMGWPVKRDVNEPDDGVGVGYMPRSIWKGKRQSAAVAFLKPVMHRPNLTVITGAVTDKLRFDGKRAVGIEVLQGGVRREIAARRGVLVCGGAVASPGVLERSGIGDPQLLGGLGIPVVHANPSVGNGSSEHRAIRLQWRLNRPLSYNTDYAGWRLGLSVLRYYLRHDGPMSAAAIEMRAAFKSRPDMPRADIQSQFGLYSWDMTSPTGALEREHGFCAVANMISPASKGSVHINTTDPDALPTIVANYNATPEDRAVLVSAARQLRQWAEQEPLASLIDHEVAPGPSAQTDAEIIAAADNQGNAGMHTVGSCRMGNDADAVVDTDLRLRGVEGVRVIDASVFPHITSGNTQAPTLALAWLAAERISAAP